METLGAALKDKLLELRSPYLLGKPIEWKPHGSGPGSLLSHRPYLLGKPIEWKRLGV